MDFDTYPTEDLQQQDIDEQGFHNSAESGIAAVEDPMLSTLPALNHGSPGHDRTASKLVDDIFGDDGDNDDDDDAGGLFGDGDDDLMQDQPSMDAAVEHYSVDDRDPMDPDGLEDDGLTEEERQRRQALEYDESDEPAMQVTKEERIAQIELANYAVPTGGKVWHARLPNFLSMDRNVFSAAHWSPPEDPEPSQPDEDAAVRKAPVPDENVMRWRWSQDDLGNFVKQSNSRIVRWSDGSLSLQIGAELFDITLTLDHSAILTSTNPTNPVPPSVAVSNSLAATSFDQNRGHSLTFLTAQHDYTELLEAQASVAGTLTFRPTTLQSNTHRRLAGSIAARNVKGRAIKIADLPQVDPEKAKADRERAEVEKAKKARKSKQRGTGSSRRKGERRATKIVFGSDDDDDEDVNEDRDGSDDDAEDADAIARGTSRRARQDEYDDEDDFLANDDEDAEGMDEDGDRDEVQEAEDRIEDERRRRKSSRRSASREAEAATEPVPLPRRRLVVEDSDEDQE